jgi:hypothetical protein
MSNLPDDIGPRLRDSLNHGAAPELSTDVVTGASERTAPKLTNPRRNLQFAGGATALVAAVAVTALVVGPGLSRAPLFTEAAASAQTGNSSSANVPTAHGLFRLWADYHYHAGSNLSTSGGSGDVYQLTRSGSGSERITALASAFGIAGGDVVTDDSDPANPEFTIGAIDGSTPALYLTWSGTGDWSYSDEDADPALTCPPTAASGAGASGSSGGSSSGASPGTSSSSSGPVSPPNCVSTDRPIGPDKAPTGADARSQAQKIFAETGLNVSASDIQLMSDSSQTTATADLEVGGVKTALDWGVSWSSTGKISSAYGSSVAVVDRGSYGTISAADAVQRLSDSRWLGSAGPEYSGGIRPFVMLGVGGNKSTSTGSAPVPGTISNSIATPAPTPVPTVVPTVQPTAGPTAAPTDVPTAVPTGVATPQPTPTGPPIINVTITTAAATLLLIWDSNGNGWLVPGYAMRVQDQSWISVVSLVPGVIQLPPVPTVEPDIVAPGVAP